MNIVSVNVGLPREFVWRGEPVITAIFKSPVQGRVMIRETNLDGDRQANLAVHGGPLKAVYAYPSEHYERWQSELGIPLSWGNFGENLTTSGLTEDTVHIGDRLQVGSAILTVVQPRTPCQKLNIRFDRDDMIKRLLQSGRSGFYLSVEKEGEVEPGSPIEILSRESNGVSVADINRLYLDRTPDWELLNRALSVRALPTSWKRELERKAAARHA